MRLVNSANNNIDAKHPRVEDFAEDRHACNGSNLINHHHAQAIRSEDKASDLAVDRPAKTLPLINRWSLLLLLENIYYYNIDYIIIFVYYHNIIIRYYI